MDTVHILQPQLRAQMIQKKDPLVQGLQDRHVEIRAHDLQRDAGKAGPRADIAEMRQLKVQKRKQRVEKMLLIHLCFCRDRGQVHLLIPLCQLLHIPVKLRHLHIARLLPMILQDLNERLSRK